LQASRSPGNSLALSKLRVTAQQQAADKSAQLHFDHHRTHSHNIDLLLTNNRTLHTNNPENAVYAYQQYSPGKAQPLVKNPEKDELNYVRNVQQNSRDVRKLIQKALNRKTISHAYHTNVPVFLKSQGPFAIYDHSLRYHGVPSETNSGHKTVTDKTTLKALQRHEQEIEALRQKREGEKDVFYQNINNERRQMLEASLDHKRNMKANQAVIEQQIAASKIVKST